jgi:hypothetical protein
VEKVVAVDENSDASAMSEFPRRAGGRIKLHEETSQLMVWAIQGSHGRCDHSVDGVRLDLLNTDSYLNLSYQIE